MTDIRFRRLETVSSDHEERITELEREERRSRKRLHELESDRHSLSLAVRAVKQLADQVGASHENLERIAEGAASRAIVKDREARSEGRWKTSVRVATILGGLGGIGYLVAYLITGNP